MTVPLLRPGQTHDAVPKMKKALVPELLKLGERPFAALIRLDSKTYGSRAVNGVKRFQKHKRLGVDGIVGKDTWGALGFDEPVVDEGPQVLHGVPREEGVVAVDGNWVDALLAQETLAQRRAGRWNGVVYSGFRPPWYQKRLFDQAVAKYGSVEKARKWVAPPGKSHHGMKGGRGAVDVTLGGQLDGSSGRLVRPLSWEEWHVQLAGSREMPEDAEAEPDLTEPTSEELGASGITMDDVDEAIAVMLETVETSDAAGDYEDAEGGYDSQAPGKGG